MQFHRSTVAAIAAAAILTLFAADGSGANAEPSAIQKTNAPALTDETVPAVQFTATPVVQPIPSETMENPALPLGDVQHDSLAEAVAAMPRGTALSNELECLAGAVYFESRGEPLAGQLAVAQVVINRADSGRFPSSYCGVVYQPSQFSFVRGGTMPRIDRSSAAWHRASAIARVAHEGLWDSKAGDALYFHARYVKPGWSRTRIARATIDSHIFYR